MGIFVGVLQEIELFVVGHARPSVRLLCSALRKPTTHPVSQSDSQSVFSEPEEEISFRWLGREEELDQQQHPGGVRGEEVGNPILLIAPI